MPNQKPDPRIEYLTLLRMVAELPLKNSGAKPKVRALAKSMVKHIDAEIGRIPCAAT